jgi:hypothetical protein
MTKENVAIIGFGNHMQRNLVPALLKLQASNIINIVVLSRKNKDKTDAAYLNVPVVETLDELKNYDINTLVASGPPSLHESVIKYCIENKKRCFVEKPHLLEHYNGIENNPDLQLMIGYNFNFVPTLLSIKDIDLIECGTKGLYMDWGNVFLPQINDYMYALQSVIVHPISIMVQKHGAPISVEINHFENSDQNVELTIGLKYVDKTRIINYSSRRETFFLDVYAYGDTHECKEHKAGTYYAMMNYFFDPVNRAHLEYNNSKVGYDVLNVVKQCEMFLLEHC